MRFILGLLLSALVSTSSFAQTAANEKAFDFIDPKDPSTSLGSILGNGSIRVGGAVVSDLGQFNSTGDFSISADSNSDGTNAVYIYEGADVIASFNWDGQVALGLGAVKSTFTAAGHLNLAGHIQLTSANGIQFFDSATKIYETGGLNLDSGNATRPIIFRINGDETAQIVNTSSGTLRLTNTDSAANRYAEISAQNTGGQETILDFGVNNGAGVTSLLALEGNANTVYIGAEAARSTFTATGTLEVPNTITVKRDEPGGEGTFNLKGLQVWNTRTDSAATIELRNDAQRWELRTETNDIFKLKNITNGKDVIRIHPASAPDNLITAEADKLMFKPSAVSPAVRSTFSATGLEVGGDLTASHIFTADGGNKTDPIIAPSNDTDTGIFFDVANEMAFTAGDTEAMRIKSSGGVVLSSFLQLDSVDIATLEGTQPTAVGQVYYCSDCLNAVHVVVSTGTTANGQFDSFTGGTAWH